MELSRISSLHHQSSFPFCTNANFISCLVLFYVNEPNTSLLWNYKLGHAHFPSIRPTQCNIPISNKANTLLCKSFCIGKPHKIHGPLASNVYIAPFDVVHMDLWGPTPFPSSSGFLYYISFVNAYTKYTYIYFLKHKFEALYAFKLFLKFVQTQLHTKIKSLQSDYVGEFRSFTKYLYELGISHRLTCSRTSHKNRTMEKT